MSHSFSLSFVKFFLLVFLAATNPQFAVATKTVMDSNTSDADPDAFIDPDVVIDPDAVIDVEHGILLSFPYIAEIVPNLLSWSHSNKDPTETLDCINWLKTTD